MTAVDFEPSKAAELLAGSSASLAGVEVRRLEGLAEIMATTELFAEVWDTAPDTLMPVGVLRALHHAHNYTVGAFRNGRLVAAGVGFLGDAPDGCRHLHSHIVGVRAGEQGRSVGYALKLDQRAWALARGMDEIRWTFDPLVRRNAWFNLVKLGCVIAHYYPDFYGPMEDGVNAGDASDRALVVWRLQSASTHGALDRGTGAPSGPIAAPAGATVVLDADGDGRPSPRSHRGEVRLCRVPEDILRMRAEDQSTARAWRVAVREAFVAALDAGLVGSGITADGFYVLSPQEEYA